MAGSSDEGRSNNPGRPAGKRGKFSFRVTPELREKLEALSAEKGRPVSEEIELRLEESFTIDRIISNAIDRSVKGGADAAVKALKDMVGGEHFFFVGMNLAVWYRSAVRETATADNQMAWVRDEIRYGVVKKVMHQGVDEWLETIRGSSLLMNDPTLEKVTTLLFDAVQSGKEEAIQATADAKAGQKRQKPSRRKPSA